MADTLYRGIDFQNSIVTWNSDLVVWNGDVVTFRYVYNECVGE